MGSNALANKQWVKGIALLLSEIIFIVWFIFSGISALSMLVTLGSNKSKKVVYDASQGVYVTKQPSNSVLILLFGILAIILCLAIVYLYIINLRSTRKKIIF